MGILAIKKIVDLAAWRQPHHQDSLMALGVSMSHDSSCSLKLPR